MSTATRTIENLSTLQPTTHLYELSEPFNGNTHVAVTVATLPNCPDEAIVLAADSTGAVLPEPSQMRMWILHRATNRTHAEALSDIGYELAQED